MRISKELSPLTVFWYELIWLLSGAIVFTSFKRRLQVKISKIFVRHANLNLEILDFLLRKIDVDWYSQTNGVNGTLPACLLHFLWIGQQMGLSPCPELTVKPTKYLCWFGVQVLHGVGIYPSFNNAGENAILADPNHQRQSNVHDSPKTCIVTSIFGSADEVLPFAFDLGNGSRAFVICDPQDERLFAGRSKVHLPNC